MTRILSGTKFNGLAILGSKAGVTTFQVGADNVSTDQIKVTTTNLAADAAVTGATASKLTGTSSANALLAITSLDAALVKVGSERATYGAIQNRFQTAINNLQVGIESQSAARSRILDADFAAETAAMTRGQILQQAGTAMLAQANQLPNTVLSLLR